MADLIKALTIRQPWAWAIARGFKLIENRVWTTPHRGQLAIHSGKQWDDLGETVLSEVARLVRAQGGQLPTTLASDLPLSEVGMVIATVDLVSICVASKKDPTVDCGCGPWAARGQAHWKLANPQPLQHPFFAKGQRSLWEVTIRG